MALLRSFCSLALTLVALSALSPSAVHVNAALDPAGPSQCVAFDSFWNLLAFNYGGKDYNAGALAGETTTITPKDITSASNRPPFDVTSSSPLCFTSQFTNSIYVLNADKSDTSSVYIYDAGRGTWSKQPTTNAPSSYDPKTFGVILDRDTNVFYAISQGTMYSLDMALKANGSSEAVPWNEVQKPDLTQTSEDAPGTVSFSDYQPTLALAQNHVHFMGVPGMKEGDLKVFVIHYSYMQPLPQSYGSFPNVHGKTASFFKDIGVQTQFAYIPDDGKTTLVVDVISNQTTTFPPPPTVDPFASYAASTSALVQLSSDSGKLSWMNYAPDGAASATWKSLTLTGVDVSAPAASSSSSGNIKNSASTTPASGTKNTSPNSNGGSLTAADASGALALRVGAWNGMVMGLIGVLGAVALAL